jgi:hypothetical protein
MEKCGMDRRRYTRPGLLACCYFLAVFFLILSALVWAEEGIDQTRLEGPDGETGTPEVLAALAVTSPERPIAGGFWTVTILADHPTASQVTVRPPQFPPGLVLERVRTEGRLMTRPGRLDEAGPAPEPTRWTAVEFLFAAVSAGNITLEAFEVSVPGKTAYVGPVSVRVYEGKTGKRPPPVFAWENPPASLVLGEEGQINLTLSNWNPQHKAPENFLRGKGLENAIVEELPFKAFGNIIRYQFIIIPLSGEALNIEAHSFSAAGDTGGLSLSVPRLSIALKKPPASPAASPPVPEAASSPGAEAAAEEPAAGQNSGGRGAGQEAIFPRPGGDVFPLIRDDFRRIAQESEALWNEGRRVEALAFLRRNERDSLSGPALAPLRREAEKRLGLSLTEDEVWQPWKTHAFTGLCVFLLIGAGILFYKFRVTSGKFSGYRSIFYLVIPGVLAILLVLGRGTDFLGSRGKRRRAVLEAANAYRVPETGGGVNSFFSEGQPVDIRSNESGWVYAETADGRAGWVQVEKVIFY